MVDSTVNKSLSLKSADLLKWDSTVDVSMGNF